MMIRPSLLALACLFAPAQERAQEFRLPTGLRCILVENHARPLVRMELKVALGQGFDPDLDNGSVGVLARLLASAGAGSYSRADFNRAADDLGLVLAFEGRRDGLYWRVLAPSTAQEPAMAFLANAVFRPALDGPALETERKLLTKNAAILPLREAGIAAFEWDLRDPRALLEPHGAGLDRLRLPELLALQQRLLRPENAVLVLYGDLSLAQARQLALLHLGVWGPAPVPAGAATTAPASAQAPAQAGAATSAPASAQAPAQAGAATTAPASAQSPAQAGAATTAPASAQFPAQAGAATTAPASAQAPAQAGVATTAPASAQSPAQAGAATLASASPRFSALLEGGSPAELWAGAPRPASVRPELEELLTILLEGIALTPYDGLDLTAALEQGGPIRFKATGREASRPTLVPGLLLALDLLRSKGFSEGDLERAKVRWRARNLARTLHPAAQVRQLLREPATAAAVAELTSQEVDAALAAWLQPEAMRFLLLGGDQAMLQAGEKALGTAVLLKP